jgi:hypothetical protein
MSITTFTLTEQKKEYGIDISDDYSNLESWWNPKRGNLYLSLPYLQGVCEAAPKGMQLIFLRFRCKDEVVGYACYQALQLNGGSHFKPEEERKNSKGFFYNLLNFIRTKIISKTKINVLVAGNLMNVGTNFIEFYGITEELQFSLMGRSIKRTMLYLRQKTGRKFDTSLVKELNESSRVCIETFKRFRYQDFKVEPNMRIPIEWDHFEAYLSSMSSKYRVRYRRARKKLDGIEIRPLTLLDLDAFKERMHELYLEIANSAQLNLVNLNPNYHIRLKEKLGDDIHIIGYFLDQKMVGFYTLLVNNKSIDAGYLGIDSKYNLSYQIYLNMLYDMVDQAIGIGAEDLIFARTALEIKSSVGAIPEEKVLLVRHQNPILHRLTKEFLKTFNKAPHWKQRHPFKRKN